METFALLAQSGDLPRWVEFMFAPERMGLMVPLIAILGGITYAIVRATIRHRERMAKIQQGIDPDTNERYG